MALSAWWTPAAPADVGGTLALECPLRLADWRAGEFDPIDLNPVGRPLLPTRSLRPAGALRAQGNISKFSRAGHLAGAARSLMVHSHMDTFEEVVDDDLIRGRE
jgi:hypothetical protein